MEQKIIIPTVSSEFEKFDIINYNKNKVNEQRRFYLNENTYIHTGASAGYSEAIYSDKSYFSITKNYFKNGNIEIKGVSFNNGSEYGIWYEFNEEGKLIKEINTDEGYDFGWRKIIAYCEANEIPLTKGFKEFVGFQTRILKQEENGKKIWVITYLLPVGYKALQITLDGKTGKELKRKELDVIGG